MQSKKNVYARILALNPGGVPRWWRFYDNGGESFDRYSACMTGKNNDKFYRGMSAHPYHPQGFGISGEGTCVGPADMAGVPNGARVPCKIGAWHPNRKGWGKRITFQQLPPDCQLSVLQDEWTRRTDPGCTGKGPRIRLCWRTATSCGPGNWNMSTAMAATVPEGAWWSFAPV